VLYRAQGQYDRAELLLRELADSWKQKAGADSLQYARPLADLGLNRLLQKKGAEAEEVLRDCLAIRSQKEPEAWTTFSAQSLLGGALTSQQKYAEAEPLLLQGYQGMKERQAKIPEPAKRALTEALERLVQLYEAWGKPDEAVRWRQELEAARAATKETKP
jgi:hypothetical protein